MSNAPAGSATTLLRYKYSVNFAALRALQAMEILAFEHINAVRMADLLGVNARTARRLLNTLCNAGYLEQTHLRRRGIVYTPTARMMAITAQMAPRLPLVRAAERAVRDLHEQTGFAAYAVCPTYVEVFVIARAGGVVAPVWDRTAASSCAGGRALLAYRGQWRASLAPDGELESMAQEIRACGYATIRGHDGTVDELAAPVSETDGEPIVALAVSCPAALADVSDLADTVLEAASHAAVCCDV